MNLDYKHQKDSTAILINRGHDTECFKEAVIKLRKKNINVVTHIIFGLPYESYDDMIETVKFINTLDIQGIKYHLLYIIKTHNLQKSI